MTQPEAQQEFFDALADNDPARLEASLKAGANPDIKDAKRGFTFALIIAVVRAQPDTLRLLLKYGAAVDVEDELNDTPLLVATRLGDPEIAAPLLEKGARLDVIDRDGMTPVGIAFHMRNMPLRRLFAETLSRRQEKALEAEIRALTAGTSAPMSIHFPLRLKIPSGT
jgi:ankyrin repeat protein